jgi:hypothetical protein
LELAVPRDAHDQTPNLRKLAILSIQTDKSGNYILRSRDGCVGGTFINRQAALREVDDQTHLSGRTTVIVIESENAANGSERT